MQVGAYSPCSLENCSTPLYLAILDLKINLLFFHIKMYLYYWMEFLTHIGSRQKPHGYEHLVTN